MTAPSPSVRLLQAYDEYIVGYTQSKYLLDLGGLVAAVPDKLALPNGVIVVDTQVAGRWKRSVRKDEVVVEAALYQPFDAAESRALQVAADELGAFLGAPAVVAVSVL
ncbi:DNA glycosylase AlkZ-like family protein [Jiangella mangrovi]|uniref:Winged helix DNA-binding domain-containing protein n=1 Tax=Jiangella mangrovi TaxID=1524084 RepID=A0A7W9GNZ2_9ACTN|nr:hypothetical protein [Jiangella mangrovi]